MAHSFNYCILIGNVRGEPDIECIGARQIVVRFTVVTERSDGATDCHRIVCRGAQAQAALDCARSNKTVQVVGEIVYNASYVGFGQVARSAEVLARRIDPLKSGPILAVLPQTGSHSEKIAA